MSSRLTVDDVVVASVLAGSRERMTIGERRAVVTVLHKCRWSDRKIADHVGIATVTAWRIRRELGLSPYPHADLVKASSNV